ncbi:MAG TPA: EthD domain-containing protein [Acidimicrobiales bacterium]|nr:EthD domain-containing protein [Acidimicrobiales bacterium]
MTKLVFCVCRRPDVDETEFHRYWRDVHGPLAASFAPVLGIRRYTQVHATPGPVSTALALSRGAPEAFDGVAELWFDSTDALMAAANTPEGMAAGEALLEDERRFIDHARSPIFLAEEFPVL